MNPTDDRADGPGDDGPLPPLYLPRLREPLPAPPTRPGRVPPLPAGLHFRAGTPPAELPAVAPYRWRSPDGRRTALLAVPQVAPPDRALALVVRPADDLVGRPVVLGGLRGEVGPGGVVRFDWDDVAAVGDRVEHLAVGGKAAWECLTPGGG